MKKGLIVLLVCFVLIAGVVGCKSAESGQPEDTRLDELIIANSQGSISYPLAYMMENNMMQDFADNMSTIHWNDGDQLKAMITSEQVNFACTPIPSAAMLYNKGLDIKLINVATWGMLYLLGSDTTITSIEDLRGKEIAINEKNGIHDLVFRHIVAKHGLDPEKDLSITYIDLAEAATKLAMGELELAISNEPKSSATIMAAKANNVDLKRLLNIEDEWRNITPNKDGKIPQAGLIVVGKNAENRALVEAILARYDEGSDWVNNHPEEGGEIVEKYFESMKAKGVTASIPYAKLAPLPAKDCQKYIEDFFHELQSTDSLKVIGGKLPDENFYYVSQ